MAESVVEIKTRLVGTSISFVNFRFDTFIALRICVLFICTYSDHLNICTVHPQDSSILNLKKIVRANMRVDRSWNEAAAACSEQHVHLAGVQGCLFWSSEVFILEFRGVYFGVQMCLFWTDFEILMWNAFENPTVETGGT